MYMCINLYGQSDDNNLAVLCCVVLQVIIRYEMSPLVRISPQKKVCSSVLNKVIAMLAAKPDRRIKLLE